MRMNRTYKLALGLVFLACTIPIGLAAQTSSADTDQKVADLEKQLQAIRAELDAMKAQPAAAPAATPEARAEPAAAAPAPPPDPLAGIKSVLGGVNLTGLVDVYYGYNANHPVAGTYTEPFSFRSNRFGLTLIELQFVQTVAK